MDYFRSHPRSTDTMWLQECAAVAEYCTGRGLDPGAGGRTLDADTACLDLTPTAPQVQQGDARALPFPDASFDFVFNAHLLEHLPDPRGAISEWLRVVRVGGYVAMVIPDTRWTQGRNTDPTPHCFEWSPQEFCTDVLGYRCGFTESWFDARPMLSWAPGTVVVLGEACPRWSFACVIQKTASVEESAHA